MKKLLFTLALGLLSFVLCPSSLHGQTIPPPYINYQAVLYDVNSANPTTVLANQSFPTFVNIQDELGNLLYKEEHYASTDANGLITVKMGDGVYMAGPITNFNLINWGVGKYYLVVDFDINGTISSTTPEQLITVPYSFYAGKAGNGMTAVADNGNGTLTFTYENGSTYTTPTLSGIQGPVGPVGPSGASGPVGATGQSAYDLWLAQGNTGTVQDFLSTSAYQIWLAQGNTGTAQDFLNTLAGPSGATGPAGPQGIQGSIGLTGATGPQGIQGPPGNDGVTGPQGPQGLPGAYAAGNGITISNNTISVNSSQLPQASQGVNLGFSSSSTWTCPAGVTQITVELWGGGGGGGGAWVSGTCWSSSGGGKGGDGGYTKAIVDVTSGTVYTITVGNGGNGGGWGGGQVFDGQAGGISSFGGLVTGAGGGPGLKGNCMGGGGANGAIVNYTYLPLATRTYIPSGFVQIVPGNKAPGGTGGYMYSGGGSGGQSGQNGEAGFVAISY